MIQPTHEQVHALDLFATGDSLAIEAGAGCLAADTVLNINRAGKGFRATVEHVAMQVAGNAVMKRTLNGRQFTQRTRCWDPAIPTMIARAAPGGVARLGRLSSAWCSGAKETFLLTTDTGRSIRATADHPFFTAAGEWVRLGDIRPGDAVQVNSGRSRRGRAAKLQYRYVVTRFHPHQVRDSNSREKFKVPLHRAAIEAEMNNLDLNDFLHVLRTDDAAAATLTFLPPRQHVHHKDGDHRNNAVANLDPLNDSDHLRLHAVNGAANNVLWQIGVEFVTSIEPHGHEMTYDVEVADDPHNFLANGFVVHNTGKTSTLQLLADSTDERGQYVAFNKAIVVEAESKMPGNVRCATAHALAYRTVGHKYGHRLRASVRMKSWELANMLGIDRLAVTNFEGERKVLSEAFLAGLTMAAITRFCQTADEEPTYRHVPYVEGLDALNEGKRSYAVNNDVGRWLEPAMRRAWEDLQNPEGTLPYKHDCQPPGTLVRRVTRVGGTDRHAGESWVSEWEDVPIEQIEVGDKVWSWNPSTRLGIVRRIGREVTAAGWREHDGDLITITTSGRGRSSSYTPEHRCIVLLDVDLVEGNHVVYLARRGNDYRVGRTTWRTRSQDNTLGIRRRAENQDADAMWILSVHSTDAEASLAEASAAHEYSIPTWQFQSNNETMPLAQFWSRFGHNENRAIPCLDAFGRDIQHPFWQRGDGWASTRRPVEMRACNLLDGMQVLEPDEIAPHPTGALAAHRGAGGWSSISIARQRYNGRVYSLDVAEDHTYVADGIVTHNCYLKLWQLRDPHIPTDFVLFDEAQDANPVMAAIVAAQTHAQLVWVGDSQQQVYCQPIGTKVRVPRRVGGGRGRGGPRYEYDEVNIEDLVVGDRVVSYGISSRLLRKSGSPVVATTRRAYRGDLITMTTANGLATRVTPDHHCVVLIGDCLDSRHVVYLMRRNNQFRIGRCQWRYGSQNNVSGPHLRCSHEGADAFWILSDHGDAEEATLAEATLSHQYNVPTWTFVPTGHRMPVAKFWENVGENYSAAERLLRDHGLRADSPLWGRGNGNLLLRRPLVTLACNLRTGMRVLPADNFTRHSRSSYGWGTGWEQITVRRDRFDGEIVSLSVDRDHTYVADGIVTHNSFTGAINALDEIAADHRAMLTQSFRFGPAIADVANGLLSRLNAPIRLTGTASIPSAVREVSAPEVILARTNARSVRAVLSAQRTGWKVHLVGGGHEILSFARAALSLQQGRRTEHPELACFDSWAEVRDYVHQDEQGGELRLMVNLVDEFGAGQIIDALGRSVSEQQADLVVSTAHKAKGREWASVQLADDFPDDPAGEELRLLYVAVTRAKLALDITRVAFFDDPVLA